METEKAELKRLGQGPGGFERSKAAVQQLFSRLLQPLDHRDNFKVTKTGSFAQSYK